MKNTGFDKALFKSAVTFNVKNMFRRTIDEASADLPGCGLYSKGRYH